jgi:arylsulfatase A-like enzyme
VRRSGARGGAPLVVCAVLLGACGGAPDPAWIDLAALEPSGAWAAGPLSEGLRSVEQDGTRWLVAAIGPAEWKAVGPGRYWTGLPVLAVGHPVGEESPYRLVVEGQALTYEPDPARFGETTERFTTNAAQALRLELLRAPDAPAPSTAELWACLDFDRRVNGLARVRGRRLSGFGFFVPSGSPRALELALPPDARLTFATAVEPLLGRREGRTAPHTFRLRLDGVPLFEQQIEVGALGEALAWHALDLPRGGATRARLELEVEGPPALTTFLAPTIGPREVGSRGARPYPARPDLVVFLADTFRADNLEAYGSALALTPQIDRFAREARVFEQAWSVSTHTLPAHSSMFSGVYPHQNGQVDYDNPLPDAVETLAERLSASGYRCGLVSDGVMVSSAHGLDQGFALFDERREAGTLERVRSFLTADDGRPVFLFVQTYAAHTPYTVSEETRARLGSRLTLDQGFEELARSPLIATSELLPLGAEAPPRAPEAVELARRLHDLYRAGVADLDGLFGRARAELERQGLLPGGYLLFTSDHGESFFEHGRPFHTNWVYETELHVPLLFAGPGLEPGSEHRRVSLIDLAPTLAALAGLEPREHWRGRSLLAPPEERVLYAFQSRRVYPNSTFAILDGSRKVIGYENLADVRAGKLHAAFDLDQDPREESSVHARAEWPAELLTRHAAELEVLLTPLVEEGRVRRTPEHIEELRKLGYDGSEPGPTDE